MFKPMLAATAQLDALNENFFQSIKLEGVRAQFTPDEGLVTRQLKPFNNTIIYERFDAVERYCYDHNIMLEGEFYVQGWDFKRIDSCCRGEGNIDARQMEFHVFDCWDPEQPDLPFEQRYELYKQHVTALCALVGHIVHAVMQYPYASESDAMQAYGWAIEHGYEGLCFKRKDLAYKLGRSTVKQGYFLRIKPENPYDGIVLGFIERQHNLMESETNELGQLFKRQNKDMKRAAGMVQNALVYTPEIDKIHKVAMTRGLTDPDRAMLWDTQDQYIGCGIQWVGIPVPGQDIPRSPRFDKWRHDIQPTFLAHDSGSLMVEWDADKVASYLESGCDAIPVTTFLERVASGEWQLGK